MVLIYFESFGRLLLVCLGKVGVGICALQLAQVFVALASD